MNAKHQTPESLLRVGKCLSYQNHIFEIKEIKGGRVYMYNPLLKTQSIDWLRACNWIERGILQEAQ